MSDSLIESTRNDRRHPGEPRPDDADGAEDLGCFGWLRGVRDRAIMLELRKKDGSVIAVGYAWMERAEFDPSEGITLHVSNQTVRIKGARLNAEARDAVRLFDGIVRHRVPWIRENSRTDALASEPDAVSIESIEVES